MVVVVSGLISIAHRETCWNLRLSSLFDVCVEVCLETEKMPREGKSEKELANDCFFVWNGQSFLSVRLFSAPPRRLPPLDHTKPLPSEPNDRSFSVWVVALSPPNTDCYAREIFFSLLVWKRSSQ